MSETPFRLSQISTRWSLLSDPLQFALRYAPAIRSYLLALLRDADRADEVAQEFLLRVVQGGFAPPETVRGRFRDYLKVSVRNAALAALRRREPAAAMDGLLRDVPATDATPPEEREWLNEWRRCLLERSWHALELRQADAAGVPYHTVLRLAADHPDEGSPALAARAATLLGRTLRPDAFRKQLSRARRLFAELIVTEIAETLNEPTPEAVAEELIEVGLMEHVRPFLPADWRTRGELIDTE
jgi:hypothetical protein